MSSRGSSDPPSAPPRPDEPTPAGRGALWAGMARRAQSARERGGDFVSDLESRRPDSPVVEAGFRWLARDKQIAGGILSGGLAYRFFFWALALSLLTSGGLGLVSRAGTNLQQAITDAGMSETVASAADPVADQSFASALWLFLVGCWLVVWFGWGVLRALWLVHAAAWRVDPPRFRRVPQGVAGVIVVPFALVLLAGIATWMRSRIGLLPGILTTLAVGLVLGAFWLWAQMKLPSKDVPWTAFAPGALAVTLGFEAMHVFSVYFLSDRIQSASALYGVLGLAATLLFFLFMFGRIIVWGAELNAVVWDVLQERRQD